MSLAWVHSHIFPFTAAVAAAVLASSTVGCTPSPGPPEQPAGVLSQLAEPLEKFGAGLIEAGAPAVVIAAQVRGQTWSKAEGVRSLENREAARSEDRLHVGSVTKSFVAVSVLKLVEEGKLRLEDPVSQYLPDFERTLHPPEPVTVRQLLQHRSGMPDYVVPLLGQGNLRDVLGTKLGNQEKLALAGTYRWERKLAQGFEYSNSNYVALGMLVETLRGQPITAALRADVIDPLGLRGTSLETASPPFPMVHGYVTISGERLDVTSSEMEAGSPAGGLISTVHDLNTFYAALLQGRLLPRSLVNEMQSPPYAQYGLGLMRRNDTCTNDFYYGHNGDIPGYGTVSMSSADGTRQVSMALAYPPAPFGYTSNGYVNEMLDVVVDALNAAC